MGFPSEPCHLYVLTECCEVLSWFVHETGARLMCCTADHLSAGFAYFEYVCPCRKIAGRQTPFKKIGGGLGQQWSLAAQNASMSWAALKEV